MITTIETDVEADGQRLVTGFRGLAAGYAGLVLDLGTHWFAPDQKK